MFYVNATHSKLLPQNKNVCKVKMDWITWGFSYCVLFMYKGHESYSIRSNRGLKHTAAALLAV